MPFIRLRASTGVSASAETNLSLSGLSAADTLTFDINGVNIGTVAISDTSDLRGVADGNDTLPLNDDDHTGLRLARDAIDDTRRANRDRDRWRGLAGRRAGQGIRDSLAGPGDAISSA